MSTGLFAGFLFAQTAAAESEGQKMLNIQTHPQLDILVNFGFENPAYSHDGVCDDPRFSGSAVDDAEAWRGDASDCREALRYGDVEIDFGYWSPSSSYDFLHANGTCDDPRFDGPGMSGVLVSHYIYKDPLDCRDLFLAGRIHFSEIHPDRRSDVCPTPLDCNSGGSAGPGNSGGRAFQGDLSIFDDEDDDGDFGAFNSVSPYQAKPEVIVEYPIPDVDFGDNSGRWAHDGLCDDPRFGGTGTGQYQPDSETGKDAADCKDAVTKKGAYLRETARGSSGEESLPVPVLSDDSWEIGPSFEPAGSLTGTETSELDEFSSDLDGYFEAPDLVSPSGETYPLSVDGIDLGDDQSKFAFDHECDDPRFDGMGMGARIARTREAEKHDASDCRERYLKNDIWLK